MVFLSKPSSICLVDTLLVHVWIVTEHRVCADPAWSSHSGVWTRQSDVQRDAGSKQNKPVWENKSVNPRVHRHLTGLLSRWRRSHIPLKWASAGWKLCESSPDDPRPRMCLCRGVGSPDPELSASLPGSRGVGLGWPDKPTILPSGVLFCGVKERASDEPALSQWWPFTQAEVDHRRQLLEFLRDPVSMHSNNSVDLLSAVYFKTHLVFLY